MSVLSANDITYTKASRKTYQIPKLESIVCCHTLKGFPQLQRWPSYSHSTNHKEICCAMYLACVHQFQVVDICFTPFSFKCSGGGICTMNWNTLFGTSSLCCICCCTYWTCDLWSIFLPICKTWNAARQAEHKLQGRHTDHAICFWTLNWIILLSKQT